MTDPFIPQLEQYASIIMKPLCLEPGRVRIYAERKEDHVHVYVADQTTRDHGQLIGSKQHTFWSLCLLLSHFGRKYGEVTFLQVMEPCVKVEKVSVPDDPNWTVEKSSGLAEFVSKVMECEQYYVGEVKATDNDGVTMITLKSSCITPPLATAVSRVLKAVSRNRGRKCEFRAEKI